MTPDPARVSGSPRADADPASASSVPRSVARMLDDAGVRLARQRVLAMCSGGLDSTCLVDVLATLPRGRQPQSIVVLFLDHGLRDVAADRSAAQSVAARHGLQMVEVQAEQLPAGPNIQGRAREWRYSEAARQARAHGCTVVATGHHADDQLETLLYALTSTSGVSAWAGIPLVRELCRAPAGSGPDAPGAQPPDAGPALTLVRPLLSVTRVQLAAYARGRDLSYADDPSNASHAFRRNRLRHEVVPQLLEIHPGAAMNLERSRRLLARQSQAERELAAAVLSGAVDDQGGLDVRLLGGLGADARHAVIAAWLRDQGVGRALTERIVHAVADLAAAGLPQRRDATAGAAPETAAGRRRVAMPGACVVRDRYHLHVQTAGGASDEG